jgi:hypothetical protein
MSFVLSPDLVDPELRPLMAAVERGLQTAGTPFISYFRPEEMLALAREAGFKAVWHVSTTDLAQRYFADRTDGLRPARGEELLIAAT